jgi:RNA polymerase sigma-70 factor, ECF subfamily
MPSVTSLPDAWVALPAEFGGAPVQAREEDELWQAATAGDTAALRRIYDRHAPSIHRFVRDLVRDDSVAADATQETFARAFQRLGALRDSGRLRPWLFGIARNVALEQGKARRRARRVAPVCDSVPREEIDALDPEALLLGREAAGVVRKALAHLGGDRRAVLLLRIDHGLSYDDIAQSMGWSLAKVKVEIHRARLALRAKLAEWGGAT